METIRVSWIIMMGKFVYQLSLWLDPHDMVQVISSQVALIISET